MKASANAVVMGCSAGGMSALRSLLGGIRKDFSWPILVVCHTGSEDMAILCELIGTHSPLPVLEARERQRAMAGTVYIAPTGYHLLVEPGGRFALSVDERVAFARPANDVLFETAANVFGAGLVGVIMTGANSDGAAGLKRLRERGGIAIVQDPTEAEVATMPQAALDTAGADYCVHLNDIALLLNRLCRR